MKAKARVESKRQRPGEDPYVFARRRPDRVVTVELPDVVTNPDDMRQPGVSYVGIRKPNATGTLAPFVGNFPCPLSPSGVCRHGGNKHFNYEFMSGTSSYCRKSDKWVHDLASCPIANAKGDVKGETSDA